MIRPVTPAANRVSPLSIYIRYICLKEFCLAGRTDA
jgi:hypothetical protein